MRSAAIRSQKSANKSIKALSILCRENGWKRSERSPFPWRQSTGRRSWQRRGGRPCRNAESVSMAVELRN